MKTRHFLPVLSLALALASCRNTPPPTVEAPLSRAHRTASFDVKANAGWNDTRLKLEKGRSYRFTVQGEWCDWIVPCDGQGPKGTLGRLSTLPFRSSYRYSSRRDPASTVLIPVGVIGRSEGLDTPADAFVIRDGMTFRPPKNGLLSVFANDVPTGGAYSNNKGALRVSVTQLSR